MKTLFLLFDGLGDMRYRELGNKTPLEKARTPTLDRLAYNAFCGRLIPAGLGKQVPISDASVMLMANLGYDVRKIKPSRGVVETIGAGLRIKNGYLCARTNFAVVDKNWTIKKLRAGAKDAKRLEKKINRIKFYVPFRFISTVGHRGVLVFHGKFSDKIPVPDPHRIGARVRKSSKMLNDFMELVYRALKGERANFLLIRGLGSRIPEVKKFPMKACALTSMPVNIGIARLVGMKVIEVPEDVPGELALKKKPIERALSKYDFVFVHFKNMDEPGHHGKVREKVRQIELTDKFLGNLDLKNKIVIVTSDHCTVCKKKTHTTDPIPTMISFGPSDKKRKFGERYCTDFEIPSHELLDYITDVC